MMKGLLMPTTIKLAAIVTVLFSAVLLLLRFPGLVIIIGNTICVLLAVSIVHDVIKTILRR